MKVLLYNLPVRTLQKNINICASFSEVDICTKIAQMVMEELPCTSINLGTSSTVQYKLVKRQIFLDEHSNTKSGAVLILN